MFSKVLIANRGEIAVRIMQTCREMGIRTVAVYSAADEGALHVRSADEAFHIGPPPAAESYLNIEAILGAARKSNAEAIHPGYGFLAENAKLARAVQGAGMIWVGPSPDAIALLGDKVASKQLAEAASVPVVPGYAGEDQSTERLLAEADQVGYPVMIKAAAGGGGRGMRAVSQRDNAAEAIEAARREARSAFGDDRIFLERLLLKPRHIEIQLLADDHGNVIYLGERECSIQRRHQKVVEEAPSPVLTPRLRAQMGEDAVRLARRCGYVNAGTVEFLCSGDAYYFLEMNTRIQVEHPVTEMVTGLDLVRLQLEIAAREPLRLSQLDVRLRGHAIEARVYAEDAENAFLPATGRLEVYQAPQGPGIRNDVGVFAGASVTPYYDPMVAKLIVWAETREAALTRLRAALDRYLALGVTTNLPFLRWIACRPEFAAGRTDTDFVDREWAPQVEGGLPPEVLLAAVAADVTAADRPDHGVEGEQQGGYDPWRQAGSWRLAGGTRRLAYRWREREYAAEAMRRDHREWQITVDGVPHEVTVDTEAPGSLLLRQGTRAYPCGILRRGGLVVVGYRGAVYHLHRADLLAVEGGLSGPAASSIGLSAPMPSTVVKVAVRPGERVAARQPLVVLEAMKMEHVIQAPHDGVVHEILFAEGDLVPAGSPVVRMEAT